MADNSEEEILDNPENSQPANLSDEIIPAFEVETTITNQETDSKADWPNCCDLIVM